MASIADQVRVLCDKEEELVDVLSEKNPEIARNLYTKCIISDTMWKQYDCLDHERLEEQLQVRFLLRLVSKNLENDAAVWGKFLNLLSAMGSTFNTVSKNLQDLLNEYTSSDREPHTAVDGEKSEVILTSADSEELTRRLAEIAYKWEELAIALKLPDSERGKIRNENKSFEIRLNRVLVSWLSGNHVHTTTTLGTLVETLCSQLVSKPSLGKEIEETYRPVKRAKLSKDLTGQYPNLTIINQSFNTAVADGKSTLLFVQASNKKNIIYEWEKDGHSLAASSTYSGIDSDILVISHARQGTEGEYSCQVSSEGKSFRGNKIILTLQYSPAKQQLLDLYSAASEVPQDFWPPSGNRTFINLALIESNKEPTAPTVKGNPDLTKEKFRKKRIEYEHVFHDSASGRLVLIEGCPGCGKTTLVHKLIKDWSKGEVLVNARLAVLITLRDLNGRKAETLGDIFTCVSQNGEDIVRAVSSDGGEGVCLIMDGLDEYQPQQKSSSYIYRLLNKTVLPKAMVVVSTRPAAVKDLKWDKLSIRMEVFGFTRQQIKEYIDCYPFMTNAYDSDHSEEVTGLSSASVQSAKSNSNDDSELDRYFNIIRDMCGNSHDGETVNVLKKYLNSNPHILEMCYLPVNLAMICFLFDSKHGHIPNTKTRLYEEFTCCIILRHLKRSDSEAQLESLQVLPENTKKDFQDLCLLAYKMTINSRQVVNPREFGIDLSKGNLHGDMKNLGLVTNSHMATTKGYQSTCAFLHLTLQEFLAAYYVSSLNIADQRREIKKHRYSAMSMVWTFYCGLVDFSDGIERLNDLLGGGSYDAKDVMHFALESQQSVVCDEVVRYAHGKFYAETPSDLSALDYILSTSQAVSKLELVPDVEEDIYVVLKLLHCRRQSLGHLKVLETPLIGGTSFELMLLALLETCQKLETISAGILGLNIKEVAVKAYIYSLCSLRYLQELKLQCYSFNSHSVTHLFSGLQQLPNIKLHLHFFDGDCSGVVEIGMRLPLLKNHLYSLGITNSIFDGVTASALTSGLCHTPSLAELHLSDINIGYIEASILCDGLQALPSLSALNLSNNQISAYGARTLISTITLKNLRILDLSNNQIGSEGATAIAAGFQHCKHLELLNLSSNGVGSDGVRDIAAEIFHCKNLKVLLFNNNDINSDGVKDIAAKIQHCENLIMLSFIFNRIGCEGARALAAEFQHLKSLVSLSLSSNNIGSDGAKALAAEIQYCDSLKVLDLSDNNIGSDGARALASNLKHCKNLKALNLSSNVLDFDDMKYIATMIQCCENLDVYVGNNIVLVGQ